VFSLVCFCLDAKFLKFQLSVKNCFFFDSEKDIIRRNESYSREAYKIGRSHFHYSENVPDLCGLMEYLCEIPGQKDLEKPSESKAWRKLLTVSLYGGLERCLMAASKVPSATLLPDYLRDIYLKVKAGSDLLLLEYFSKNYKAPIVGGDLDVNQLATVEALGDYFFTSMHLVYPEVVFDRPGITSKVIEDSQMEVLEAAAGRKE
jgi:hypothetical protein